MGTEYLRIVMVRELHTEIYGVCYFVSLRNTDEIHHLKKLE